MMLIDFVIKQPAGAIRIFKSTSNIFLFSHMRANTSLFGHILGDNPEIMGYYEQHISYPSWKSEYRLKIEYLKNHPYKQRAKYFFDKILHDFYTVSPGLLHRKDNKIIFMLRNPEDSLPSIIKLFERVDKNHECADPKGAVEYYLTRLKTLQRLASELKGDYYYLDAEELIENTDSVLSGLTQYLALSEPLKPEYKIDIMTGVKGAGDSSNHIQSGRIEKKRDKHDLSVFTSHQVEECRMLYDSVRTLLLNGSCNRV